MHFFYGNFEEGEIIGLTEEEARHAAVLRLKLGERVGLQDGLGRIRIGELIASDKRSPHFKILSSASFPKPDPYIHLAVSLIKDRERMEWLIEKITELGVSEITPLICDHSEKSVLKKERLDKIINAAFKQCGRAWRPVLNELTVFESFVQQQIDGSRWIGLQSGLPIQTKLKEQRFHKIQICIGPEGDFSSNELKLASENNYEPVSFGPYRLRSETAGMTAVIMSQLLDQK